jgi:hypothetical protein
MDWTDLRGFQERAACRITRRDEETTWLQHDADESS